MTAISRHAIRAVLVCAFIVAILPGRAYAAEGSAPLGKLPAGVTPTHYALDLKVVPSKERFSGRVIIDLTLATASDRIWLHGRDIDVQRAVALDTSGAEVSARYEQVDDTGVARVLTDRPIGPGATKLIIDYDAPFNQSLEGLYRVDANDTSYAYTHMEPLNARRMFPGFDEPRFKTPFDLTLTVQKAHTAVANAAERETADFGAGLKRIRFETTEPLPTYLVAIAVGDFDVVEWEPIPASEHRDRPIPLRGIAVKGKGDQFAYALKHTAAMVAILEDYFGVAYPYQKLDLVAAAEFKSGGMENAAAIFYRETLVLFGDHPSIYQKRDYAYTHAHELAHQWFGDLVTPVWWDDLWLNEAFATWMSSRVAHTWRPKEYDNRSSVRRARWAMRTDRLVSARQIRQPVTGNHDIANAFDSITYSKGGAVLAMFERFMGAESFRTGIQLFLSRFAHGVATFEDFIQTLSESAEDGRVVAAFRSFIEQPGIPLLEVDWSCKDSGVVVDIRQSRYLPLGSKGSSDRQWQVPIGLVYEQNGERKRHYFLLTEPQQQVRLDANSCPRWIMPNEAGAGYYNWSLKSAAWASLAENVERLDERELLSLVGSLFAAYNAGLADVGTYLQVARAAAQSDSWDIAEGPMQDLRDIKNFVLPEALQGAAREAYWQFYRPTLARVGLSDKAQPAGEADHNAALLRSKLIWFLALDADEPVLRQQLSELGQAYVGYGTDGKLHPDVVNPNLVRASLIVATQEMGAPFFDALVKHLDRSTDAVFRSNVIATLAYQTDPDLIAKVRALIIEAKLPKREISRLIYRPSRRVANRDTVWRWATAHFDDILTRIPRSHRGSLPWLASAFCSLEKRDNVQAYFEPRISDLEGGPRSLANVLESIELCAARADRQQAGAIAYFGNK